MGHLAQSHETLHPLDTGIISRIGIWCGWVPRSHDGVPGARSRSSLSEAHGAPSSHTPRHGSRRHTKRRKPGRWGEHSPGHTRRVFAVHAWQVCWIWHGCIDPRCRSLSSLPEKDPLCSNLLETGWVVGPTQTERHARFQTWFGSCIWWVSLRRGTSFEIG